VAISDAPSIDPEISDKNDAGIVVDGSDQTVRIALDVEDRNSGPACNGCGISVRIRFTHIVDATPSGRSCFH
jgi:hypothetical protein